MDLIFPFKNWAYNTLLNFYKIGFIESFSKSEKTINDWASEEFDVKFYQDRIPSFENELIQTIDTTTQETIDYYFDVLFEEIQYARGQLTKEYLLDQIKKYNEDELEKFNQLVASKTEDYFKSENRNKAHLEQYEETIYPIFGGWGLGGKIEVVQKTNYNFYCIEDKLNYIDPDIVEEYFSFLKEQFNMFLEVVRKYGIAWEKGEIKSKAGNTVKLKAILFCEGDIDVTLIQKAAELLGKTDLLSDIELRYRGSSSNLDKLWNILIDNNWETVPQKKILLYDCDTGRPDEDFGHIYRRTIPKIDNHTIQRGIENLFPKDTIERAIKHKNAFVDFKVISGTERGVAYEKTETVINKHEKRNFCNWLLENGTADDFKNFEVIFNFIEELS